jgi:hypothetical protein
VENLDDLPGALDMLFRLHALRWPEGWLFQVRAAFHRDFAAIALARGRLRLWCLELDGQPVVAWYGLRFAGVLPGGKRSSLGPSIGGIRPLTRSIRGPSTMARTSIDSCVVRRRWSFAVLLGLLTESAELLVR